MLETYLSHLCCYTYSKPVILLSIGRYTLQSVNLERGNIANQRHEPFNEKYLQRIEGVLCNALQDHPQTTVIRVDLHLPEAGDVGDSIVSDADLSPGLMSRFIDSLKAQIVGYRQRKAREGKRCHRSSVRYVWVMEQPELGGKKHYHMALFLNTDTFNALGSYDEQGERSGLSCSERMAKCNEEA